MKTTTLRIIDEDWTVRALTEEQYAEIHQDESEGITLPEINTIDLRLNSIKFITIVHELCHAHMAVLPIQSAGLSAEQTEEVMCELMGKYIKSILIQADSVYKEFK